MTQLTLRHQTTSAAVKQTLVTRADKWIGWLILRQRNLGKVETKVAL